MNFIDQLRTLDPRDVGRWPLAVRGFFVLLIFLVCSAFAWYMFVWNDDRPVLQKAEADELDLRSQFENKQQRAANLDAYKASARRDGAQLRRHVAAAARQDRGAESVGGHLANGAGSGSSGKAVPALRRAKQGLLRRAADYVSGWSAVIMSSAPSSAA